MNYEIKIIARTNLPEKLKIIKNPPEKLYAIGDINLLFENSFAIVGTRHISEYGTRLCKYFTKEFAFRRITTVSGMALGTDTIVHEETIKNGGKTIAVLGCGFKNVFPKENEPLFHNIIESGGLILSEYQEEVIARKEYFPKRNRIVSAISEGVLVIEATYRSGTSITANNAREQGKKVFAVPGIIGMAGGVGVNNLIKKGAILTTNIEDILFKYSQFMNKKRINVSQRTSPKNEYEKIYNIIGTDGKGLDEIAEMTGLEAKELLVILSEMQMKKMVCQDFYGKYKIQERS